MAYATVADVQARMPQEMSETEQNICSNLLDDAAIIIDCYNADAALDNKRLVSIRMVLRAVNLDPDVPVGATQGSMNALGYSQSWTMPTNASVGEEYIRKLEEKLLGIGNSIGASNPLAILCPPPEDTP